jgi:hypothetical protein
MAITEKDTKKYFENLPLAALLAKKAEQDVIALQIKEALVYRRAEEIKVLADGFAKKVEAAGYSVYEAMDALKPYLPAKNAGVKRAARGSVKAKGRADADSTGASPTPGATYKLATGEVWIKSTNGKGSPKKEFLAAIKSGSKWADLVAK